MSGKPKSIKSMKKFMARSSRKAFLGVFRLFTSSGAYLGYPVIGPMLKKLAKLDRPAKTQTYALNLNADVADKAQGVVLPIDMMKQAVRQAGYRSIMDHCLCRSAYDCHDFPHDHGCIFLGEGAKGVVKNRLGREASVEEALAHIDKGAQLGLIGQAMWIEVERLLLGVKYEGVSNWLEICFCCPCCCGAFKLVRDTSQKDIKGRFRSIGWKAGLDDKICNQCRKCVKLCPVHAISLQGKQVVIDEQACLGCGFCAAHCPQKAIKLSLQSPLQGTIQDYFTQGGLKVNIQ
ncbi:MAG: 4Fe-4S binding protein [bacterium]|nr:4Fe-4S binding protein [bacterium]